MEGRNIGSIFKDMARIAMEKNTSFDFISDLRKLFVLEETNLIHLSTSSQPEDMATLYIFDTLLGDIWKNFSTDASFEFPLDDLEMSEVCENIRKAILVLGGDEKAFKAVMAHLSNAIYGYHKCLDKMEKKLLNEGPKKGVNV